MLVQGKGGWDNGIDTLIPVHFMSQILRTNYNLLVFMVMMGRGGDLSRE